jgi:hypothetical protein
MSHALGCHCSVQARKVKLARSSGRRSLADAASFGTMEKSEERMNFSRRLLDALNKANCPTTPTELARQFNAAFSGHAISLHAVRKWLIGDSIPSQDKLRVLASLTGVTPAWLRFGLVQTEKNSNGPTLRSMDEVNVALLRELRALAPQDRIVGREIIRVLLRIDDESKRRAIPVSRHDDLAAILDLPDLDRAV